MWIIAGLIGLAAGVVLGRALAVAPEGFQDDGGFHLGRDPHTEEQARKLAALRLGITEEEIRHIEHRREWAEFG